MDATKIRELLSKQIGHLQEYAFLERPRKDLDASRCLQDIEAHGITSQQKLSERLFVCRKGRLVELNPKCHIVRRKTYGATENRSEEGEPIAKVLTGDEEWIAIASSAFVTKPKGPHASEKKVEIYL